jgi:hypothetical protein
MEDVDYSQIDAQLEAQDRAIRASASPKELLQYRRWIGELRDCDQCGAADQEVTDQGSHPDYIGHTDWFTLACGHTEVYSDGPESVR